MKQEQTAKTIATATVSDRYQTVIPLEIRRRLNLATGDKVEFEVSGDQILLRKAESPKEKRKAWLLLALENYQNEDAWGEIKDEPFRD